MSTPSKPLPELPIEVWERIIDSLDDDYDDDDNYGEARDALRACCLTCRAWVPRSRFHLYPSIVLRSKQHLTHVVNTICHSPTLCDRVKHLTIVGDDDDDVSWISVVPLQLGPKLKSLQWISFRKVDFRKMNPRFQAYFALFRPVAHVIFEDIPWSQLNQMIRLAPAVRAESFSVNPLWFYEQSPSGEASHNVKLDPVTLPSSQRLALRCPNLRLIDISLPLDVLDSISQSWSFPVASLSEVIIKTDWRGRNDSGWRMHLRTLQRIINLFQRLCASNSSFEFCDIEYWLPSGSVDASSSKCDLRLYRRHDRDPSGRHRLGLQLTYRFDTTNHDDFTSIARFLSVAARARPDVVGLLYKDEETGATHPDQITWTPANDLGPMANLLARWKCIDDVLSSDAFANVTSVSVKDIPQYRLGNFRCINPLVLQLLPRLVARGIFSACVHENFCRYHESHEGERHDSPRYHDHGPNNIAGPQSLARTSSMDIDDLALGRSAEDGIVVEVGEDRMEDDSLADDSML